MKRRLFTILSAISLLLFVVVCVLWVRSFWHQDNIGWGFWGHEAEDPENRERWFVGIVQRAEFWGVRLASYSGTGGVPRLRDPRYAAFIAASSSTDYGP